MIFCLIFSYGVCKKSSVVSVLEGSFDLNKSVDFFLNPICILRVVCTSKIAVCLVIYANKILLV